MVGSAAIARRTYDPRGRCSSSCRSQSSCLATWRPPCEQIISIMRVPALARSASPHNRCSSCFLLHTVLVQPGPAPRPLPRRRLSAAAAVGVRDEHRVLVLWLGVEPTSGRWRKQDGGHADPRLFERFVHRLTLPGSFDAIPDLLVFDFNSNNW
jgi:hypothetical protein